MAIYIEKTSKVRSSENRVGVSRGYGGDASYSMESSPCIQLPCCVWRWWPLLWWIAGSTEISVGKEEVCEETSVCVFSISCGWMW